MFLSVLSLDSAAPLLLQLGRVVYTHKLTPDGRKERGNEKGRERIKKKWSAPITNRCMPKSNVFSFFV
jgi:hypothetical protein